MNQSDHNLEIRPGDSVIRPKQAAERLGICKASLYNMVHKGEIDPPFKIGKRASGWLSSYLDEVIAQRANRSVERAS